MSDQLKSQSKTVAVSTLDESLQQVITEHRLSADPAAGITVPAVASPEVLLGKKLFFSADFSADQKTSCATCHNPLSGGGDNLPVPESPFSAYPAFHLPVHLRSGQKRDGQSAIYADSAAGTEPARRRNTASTFNVALWKEHLFSDGRITRLENGQVTTPDVPYPDPDPAAGSELVQAAAHLSELPEEKSAQWLGQFREVFNAPDGLEKTLITGPNVSRLLSAYLRSQLFVNNGWRAYVSGDTEAISDKAKRGALLFYQGRDQGGFACASCHKGDFFTDENFYHVLIPPVDLSRPAQSSLSQSLADDGRCGVTGKMDDKYRFRTPGLLNVEVTGPWGHNGAYTTLASVVRHMLDPFGEALRYDRRQILQNNMQPQLLQANLSDMLEYNVDVPGSAYTEKDVQELVAFLLTLTDPCVKSEQCLAPWLPE
ncbi:MAG: cytochrome c peroxidase [Thiolinea sp.]